MAFEKGKSGNPNGRPKVLLPDGRSLSDIAKAHTAKAIETLVEIMEDEDAPHSAKVSAINSILDRGWGRPAQSIQVGGDPDGVPVQVQQVTDAANAFKSRLVQAAAAGHADDGDGEAQS